MGANYSNIVKFAGTSGDHVCVSLPAPPRGVLRRFCVYQIKGAGGFTFDVYDRKDACHGQEPGVASPGSHRVMAPQTGVGGAHEKFDLNIAYENQDQRDEVLGRRRSALYLDMLPTMGGDFSVAYTVEKPNFM